MFPGSSSCHAEASALPALSFEEVRRLVEASSQAIRLCNDVEDAEGFELADHHLGRKGRFLVARRALLPGEVILTELPLFWGNGQGSHAMEACTREFLASDEDSDREGEDLEGLAHPKSGLVDCVAGILLCKWQGLHAEGKTERAKAALRVRKLKALARSHRPPDLPEGLVAGIFAGLQPELRRLTSEEDIMFTASMFEHACDPNTFHDCWGSSASSSGIQACKYRVMRPVAEGEALTLDYLQLPHAYLPCADRAQLLEPWGFACNCPRCTSLPDLTRAFLCEACGRPDLCAPPPEVATSAGAGLVCLSCGEPATAAYSERCYAAEEEVRRAASGNPVPVVEEPDGSSSGGLAAAHAAEGGVDDNLLGSFHYMTFELAWEVVHAGPKRCGCADTFYAAVQALVACIERLYDNARHPSLLRLYHMMAQMSQDSVDEQRHFLELEEAVIKHNFPEEAASQEREIMRLVQGPSAAPMETPMGLLSMD